MPGDWAWPAPTHPNRAIQCNHLGYTSATTEYTERELGRTGLRGWLPATDRRT